MIREILKARFSIEKFKVVTRPGAEGTELLPHWKPCRSSINARRMGLAWLLACAALALGELRAQNLQQKDLAFAHVAAGGNYETILSVTNGGHSEYRGTLHFWKGSSQDWDPIVNGTRVSGSLIEVGVSAGETRIFRINDSSLTVGAAFLVASDMSQENLIEGNLTYIMNGNNRDSVGIAPSVDLYKTVIPFEDFSTVGLALANADALHVKVVNLRLIDREGREIESATRVLAGRSHEARFLSEIFSSTIYTGKVEIDSSGPIIGTAVTLAQDEISALPMLPSPVTYTLHTVADARVQAEGMLWAEGVFVKGFLRYLKINGQLVENPETYLVTGTLVDGILRLSQFGEASINYLTIPGFTFRGKSYVGNFKRIVNPAFPFGQVIPGTFTLTRTD